MPSKNMSENSEVVKDIDSSDTEDDQCNHHSSAQQQDSDAETAVDSPTPSLKETNRKRKRAAPSSSFVPISVDAESR